MYKDSAVRGLAVTLSVKDERMSTLSCKNKTISFEVRFIWDWVIFMDKIIKSRDLQTNLLSRARRAETSTEIDGGGNYQALWPSVMILDCLILSLSLSERK